MLSGVSKNPSSRVLLLCGCLAVILSTASLPAAEQRSWGERRDSGTVWIGIRAKAVFLGEGAHNHQGWDFYDDPDRQLWIGSGWKSGDRDHRGRWGVRAIEDRVSAFERTVVPDEWVWLVVRLDFGSDEAGDEALKFWVLDELGDVPDDQAALASLEGLTVGGIRSARMYSGRDGVYEMSEPRLGRTFADLKSAPRAHPDTAPRRPDITAGDRLFATQIEPLLQAKCLACHGDDAGRIKGGFDVTSRAALLAGGESGKPGLIPGDAGRSLIYRAAERHDPDLEMPPKENDRLSPDQLARLKQWIELGAPWPDADIRGEILRETWTLEETGNGVRVPTSGGLTPEWTNRRYAREDLWAFLPREEVQAPRADGSAGEEDRSHPIDAFVLRRQREAGLQPAPRAEADTLLQRVSYSLTGLPPNNSWRRKAANGFTRESWQALLDELLGSPHYGERMAQHWLDVVRYADSNGYSRDEFREDAHAYRTYVIESFNRDKPYDRFVREQIAGDELDLAGQEALAFLWMGPWEHTSMSAEVVTRQLWLDDVVNSIGVTFLGQELRCARCHDHKFDPIPTRDYYSLQAVFASTRHHIKGGQFRIHSQVPRKLAVLKGGAVGNRGDAVRPGLLSAVKLSRRFEVPESRRGRRAALAEWMAHPENPLTARVMVNRVWQMHFGKGLVATPNNFGKTGAKPSHPELLDWLANRFVDQGWSVRELHRLILTSETWRRSTQHPALTRVRTVDPDNDLLTHFEPRRLSAEEMRDTLLAVTGELNREVGGPGNWPEIDREVAFQPRLQMGFLAKPYEADPLPEQRHRRSLYAVRLRGLMDPMMEVFNRPGSEISCERRDETTVTPQVFTLLHGQFANDRALALAHAIAEAASGAESRLRMAFRKVLHRTPLASEFAAAQAYFQEARAHHEAVAPKAERMPATVTLRSIKEQTGEPVETTFELKKLKDFQPDLKPWEVGPETRALAEVCLILFNTSEFLYVY